MSFAIPCSRLNVDEIVYELLYDKHAAQYAIRRVSDGLEVMTLDPTPHGELMPVAVADHLDGELTRLLLLAAHDSLHT